MTHTRSCGYVSARSLKARISTDFHLAQYRCNLRTTNIDRYSRAEAIWGTETPRRTLHPNPITMEHTWIKTDTSLPTKSTAQDEIPKLLREILNTLHGSDRFSRIPQDDQSRFWMLYYQVAKEHDEDFLGRYNTDLDSQLIFAGLFSAVNSAFLVDMKTALSPNPSDVTNALLRALIHMQTNASFDASSTNTVTSPGLTVTDTVIQCLAWASLAASLLAAFGAVLSKQWLAHYKATRFGRGTIEERCRRRQEKLIGLEKWNLEVILDSLPILLQFSLLLFGISLSASLLELNWAIGGILIVATLLGLTSYIFTFIAALSTSQSPFESKLSDYFRRVPFILSTLSPWKWLFSCVSTGMKHLKAGLALVILFICTGKYYVPKTSQQQHNNFHTESVIPPLYLVPVDPRGAHAVNWIIHTSTDPQILVAALKVIPNIEWPLCFGSDAIIERIVSTFDSCFDAKDNIKPGSMDLAVSCLTAGAHLYIVREPLRREATPGWMMSRSNRVRCVFKAPHCRSDIAMIWWMMRWPGLYMHKKPTSKFFADAISMNDEWVSYLLPYVVRDPSLTISSSSCLELIAWCMCRKSKTVIANSYIAASMLLGFYSPVNNEYFVKLDKSVILHVAAEQFFQSLLVKFPLEKCPSNGTEAWLYLSRLLSPLTHSLEYAVHDDHRSMFRDELSKWAINAGLHLVRKVAINRDSRSTISSVLRLGIHSAMHFTDGNGKPLDIFNMRPDSSRLIDHYLAVQSSGESLAAYDVLVILGSIELFPDPFPCIHYIKGLIYSLRPEAPRFLQHAAVRASSNIQKDLLNLTDNSLRVEFSSALARIIAGRKKRPIADEQVPIQADTSFFGAFDWLGTEDNLPRRYIKLITMLSENPDWCSLLRNDGHFRMCFEIAQTLLALSEESLYGNKINCLQFCCQYALELVPMLLKLPNLSLKGETTEIIWPLLTKAWYVLPGQRNMYDSQDMQRKAIIDSLTTTTMELFESNNIPVGPTANDLWKVIAHKLDNILNEASHSCRIGHTIEKQISELKTILSTPPS